MEHRGSLTAHSQEQPIDFGELVAHIPVGVCKFRLDEGYTLIYGNQSLYTIFGYTPDQFRAELDQKISRTFLPEDCLLVTSKLAQELACGSTGFCMEHRSLQRNGQVIWVLVSGHFISDGKTPSAYGVVVDITDRKRMEEQLRIDEERFRLALAQTDNTIFDYDIATKVMIHADKSAHLYGLTHETPNVPDYLVQEKIVHPESAQAYLEMYRQIRCGAPTASCVIQAKTLGETYAWRKVTMTTIFDPRGKPVRAVGMLEDIDEQTRREKLLLERSQRDPLTGLFNKGATEGRIRSLLGGNGSSGVLFIIDVDSFKAINDRYGHLFGDLALSESARRIAGLCRPSDVIGRIGGDEFLLYLEGAFTSDSALRKAKEVCAAFVQEFFHNGTCASITSTVGLALCPEDGDSFEMLYQKADIALYDAKRKGKNRCCLYHAGMNSHMEWVPYTSTEIDLPISPQTPL